MSQIDQSRGWHKLFDAFMWLLCNVLKIAAVFMAKEKKKEQSDE